MIVLDLTGGLYSSRSKNKTRLQAELPLGPRGDDRPGQFHRLRYRDTSNYDGWERKLRYKKQKLVIVTGDSELTRLLVTLPPRKRSSE